VSRTWLRRPRRRKHIHGLHTRDPINLRLCCGESSREPHRRDCQRHEVTCGDKHPFDSPSEAKKHAKTLMAKTDHGWRTYACPSCGLYHLTRQLDD
jgi:hypothetical protein